MRAVVGLLLSVATVTVTAKKPRWNELDSYTFEAYLIDHGKAYRTAEERAHRKEIFERNLNKIRALNKQPGMTWRAGVNSFTDWSEAEFKNWNRAKRTYYDDLDAAFDEVVRTTATDVPLPHEVDWRKTPGVLGPIRHQGICGSCWAHAAAETISSQYNLITGSTTVLSVGQVTACTSSSVADGCCGGDARQSFMYWRDQGANTSAHPAQKYITEEWAYPYPMLDFFGQYPDPYVTCSFKCIDVSKLAPQNNYSVTLNAAGVSGVGAVDSNSPTGGPAAMKALRDVGPLAIAVAASGWMFYTEGVYQNNASDPQEWEINHAVQMVGYGYDKELDENYWIVRNSWSTLWGENGFIRLWRAKSNGTEPCNYNDDPTTVCGTSGCLNEVSYPIVYQAPPIISLP